MKSRLPNKLSSFIVAVLDFHCSKNDGGFYPNPNYQYPNMQNDNSRPYRKACLHLTLALLAVWFFISFGCSILLRDWLDANFPSIGSAPFGFWMAQQGSIIGFVLILIIYAVLMNRLDHKHGYSEEK